MAVVWIEISSRSFCGEFVMCSVGFLAYLIFYDSLVRVGTLKAGRFGGTSTVSGLVQSASHRL